MLYLCTLVSIMDIFLRKIYILRPSKTVARLSGLAFKVENLTTVRCDGF